MGKKTDLLKRTFYLRPNPDPGEEENKNRNFNNHAAQVYKNAVQRPESQQTDPEPREVKKGFYVDYDDNPGGVGGSNILEPLDLPETFPPNHRFQQEATPTDEQSPGGQATQEDGNRPIETGWGGPKDTRVGQTGRAPFFSMMGRPRPGTELVGTGEGHGSRARMGEGSKNSNKSLPQKPDPHKTAYDPTIVRRKHVPKGTNPRRGSTQSNDNTPAAKTKSHEKETASPVAPRDPERGTSQMPLRGQETGRTGNQRARHTVMRVSPESNHSSSPVQRNDYEEGSDPHVFPQEVRGMSMLPREMERRGSDSRDYRGEIEERNHTVGNGSDRSGRNSDDSSRAILGAPQEKETNGSRRDREGPTEAVERIYLLLQKVKVEDESIPFISGPCSLATVEAALESLVRTYETVSSRTYDLNNKLRQSEEENKSLKAGHHDLTRQIEESSKQASISKREQERKIDGLEGEMRALKAERDRREQDLESRIEKLRNERQSEKERLVDKHQRRIEKLNNDLTVLKNDNIRAVRKLEDQHEQQLAAATGGLKTQLLQEQGDHVVTKQEHAIKIKEIEKGHVMEIEEIERQHQEDRARAADDFTSERARWKEDSRERKKQYEEKYQLHLDTVTSDLSRAKDEIRDMKNKYAGEMQRADENWQKRLESVKGDLKEERNGKAQAIQAIRVERDDAIQHAKDEAESRLRDMRSQLKRELATKDEEIKSIKDEWESDRDAHKAQVANLTRGLQETVDALQGALVKRDHFKAMSDREVASRFHMISEDVDHFARVLWDKLMESTWPFQDQSLPQSVNDRRTKQHIMQNTLWVILYEKIFCTPFRVFGSAGKSKEREWIKEFGEDRSFTGAPCPRPSKKTETWRYETMMACVEATSQQISEGEPNYNIKRGYELTLDEVTEELLLELETVAPVSDRNKQRIRDLVEKAAKLWLDVGQQRCRIFLKMSESGEVPVKSRPEHLRHGSLNLVVMPELRRFGNAQGERLEKVPELVMDCKGEFTIFRAN